MLMPWQKCKLEKATHTSIHTLKIVLTHACADPSTVTEFVHIAIFTSRKRTALWVLPGKETLELLMEKCYDDIPINN